MTTASCPGPVATLEQALDVLDRFGQALQQCTQSAQQIKLILESIRVSLDADITYWHPGNEADPIEVDGNTTFPPQWYHALTANVVGGESDALPSVLRVNLPQNHPTSPRSVALVRISRSHGSWLGAVSFSPRHSFTERDIKVMLLARRMLLSHRHQIQTQEKLRDSLFGLVRCLAAAIDAKDTYTWGHSERVARIAVRLGGEMQLSRAILNDLYLAGLLHDIGKIGIRDSVLQKPGKLTREERLHMQEHTLIGDRLVSVVNPLVYLRTGVRNHHEHFDGTGYPDGLAGSRIPFLARILSVADACDAMMAKRPYRDAMTPDRIDEIMANGAGKQWDPDIISHFLRCRYDLYSICQRGLGDSVVAAVDHVIARVRPSDAPWARHLTDS